jgi:hypothetical protein
VAKIDSNDEGRVEGEGDTACVMIGSLDGSAVGSLVSAQKQIAL